MAILMLKRPLPLLYVRGQLAESEVRLILVVTIPERVLYSVVSVARFELVFRRFPDRVLRSMSICERDPERIAT